MGAGIIELNTIKTRNKTLKKNILFMIMTGLLIVVGFGSFFAGRNDASGMELFGSKADDSAEYIGYPEYVSMYMLKDFLPYAVYKECVLPHAQKLFAKEKISKKDFLEFEQNVDKSLNKKSYSVRKIVRDYVCEESFSDSFHSNIDKFNDDARKMGKGMKQGLENFMKGLTEPERHETQTPKSTEL